MIDEGEARWAFSTKPGAVVGGYVLGEEIARGGCGAVFHARDGAGRPAALKVLHAGLAQHPKLVERFLREIEVLQRIGHPHVVEIFDVGRLPDGRPYFAMEMLGGGTLEGLLRERGRLPPEEVCAVLAPVCGALSAAHAAGIVHRDVKGSNVAFTAARAPKLLDFGIAKLTSPPPGTPGLTTVGRRIGTPSCMAPEQLLGGLIDARTDVYALGLLIYRMLTGRGAFEARSPAALARQHLEEPPPRPSRVVAVSAALDAVVVGCLEKAPERRFPSVARVLSALESAIGAEGEGPLSVRPRRGPGVAVFVDVRLRGAEELDDALTRQLGALLDRAEATLSAAGMTLAQATGMGVLGVRPLPEGREASRAARRASIGLSRALHEALGGLRGATPRIHVNVAVHTAELSFRPGDPPEILGGPLLCTAAWAPRGEVAGVAVNEAALADFGPGDRDGLISTDAATQPDGA